MTEQQYKELLQTLGINAAKSNMQIKELLEAKLNEYLDRTDAEAEQMEADIQDALDYVEALIEKMGGGIALAPEESEETEEISRDLLAGRTSERKGAITYTSSSAIGGTATGNGAQGTTTSTGAAKKAAHPWFHSLTGDANVDSLFGVARTDLQQGDFKQAESVFDTISRAEMANAGAYMGKLLAKLNLREPKDIATYYSNGVVGDPDLLRAESCGTDAQKKFIKDALEERRKGKIYVEAETVLQTSKDNSRLLQAAVKFDSISDYRDAARKADDCRIAAERYKKEEEDRKKEEERKRKEREREKEIQRRKERMKELRGKIIKYAVVVALFFGLSAFLYYEPTGVMNGFGTYFPNVAYTKSISVYGTKVPYFVSLVPIEELSISGDNVEYIFMPFGAKSITYDTAMKTVTIPKQAKKVKINCERLKELEIPDGVVSLDLFNISSELTELEIPNSVQFLELDNVSDELAKNLDLPSGLVALCLGESSKSLDEQPITDKGFQNLKLPDSLQYLNLEACNLLTEIEINTSLEGLYISGWDGLNTLTINGDVKNAFIDTVSRTGEQKNGEKYGYSVPQPLVNLTITGNVGCFEGGAVENCRFEKGPENLCMEYTGSESLSLPQNMRNLMLYVNEYENPNAGNVINSLIYPEGVENVCIYRYDAENNSWHGEAVVGTLEGANNATCNYGRDAWPEKIINEVINKQIQ